MTLSGEDMNFARSIARKRTGISDHGPQTRSIWFASGTRKATKSVPAHGSRLNGRILRADGNNGTVWKSFRSGSEFLLHANPDHPRIYSESITLSRALLDSRTQKDRGV